MKKAFTTEECIFVTIFAGIILWCSWPKIYIFTDEASF
jgi:hypothetical protein